MDSQLISIDSLRIERERHHEPTTPPVEPLAVEAPAAAELRPRRPRIHTLTEERREHERLLPAGGVLGAAGGSYKMLRTQVLRRLNELGANTLAVVSAVNGEGKTLSAFNLAVAIAADPRHTAMLVDLDLRNPSIHRRLGLEPEVGIDDCLERRRPVHEAMVRLAGYERLTLLPARGRVEMSSELLATERMAEVAHELRDRYVNRIVIFDLPPILLADDALTFARLVQAGLMVVTEGRTHRDDIARSLSLLRDLPMVGTVLNRSCESAGVYY